MIQWILAIWSLVPLPFLNPAWTSGSSCLTYCWSLAEAQNRCHFHYRGLECKSRKSRNTWNNRQIWPWSTEWSRAKASIVLPRECTGYSKHPLSTTQARTVHMDITKWSKPKSDWLYSCSQRWRSSTQSAKTRPVADCGSDHQLLIAKFRLKLKNIGKTTRPFRYDLNQIPYDYSVEVRNRFMGLDMTDRVPEEVWMEVQDTVQETGIKTIPMEKKCKKSKMAVWGGLTNSCEKKRGEKQRRKGNI